MTQKRIMYVCSECADNDPESCGRYDRNDLRVMPDDRWLCEGCFEDTTQAERGNLDDNVYLDWHNLLPAPEFLLKTAQGEPK